MFRFIISILLFLISLLIFFSAPTNLLWRVTIAITEFPHFFIIPSFILFVSCIWAEKFKYFSTILSFCALVIFTSIIFRAYNRALTIEDEMGISFNNNHYSALIDPLSKPFAFKKLFLGIGSTPVDYKKITYKKTTANNDLTFDFYPARTEMPAPCVIVIHGGSWAQGDSRQLPALNNYLSGRGYNVVSANYRLVPEFRNPAPIEDIKDLIIYLKKESAKLKIDSTNFVLLGRSAGGQIALLTAYTLNDPSIKGVISFYAPADMVWGAQIRANKWVLDTDKILCDYIGGCYKDVPEKYKLSSPLEFVNSNSAPTLLIHGSNDCMVAFEHSLHLQKKLNDFKVKNYFLNIPWGTHGCDYNISGPSGQISTFAIERFINSVVTQ